jgi:hypothetical protein
MLPDGFAWHPRYQHAPGELALKVDGHVVAQLLQRLDGRWLAQLWTHRHITAPVVSRPCQSRESGKSGIEAWACRHEARIRAEAEQR